LLSSGELARIENKKTWIFSEQLLKTQPVPFFLVQNSLSKSFFKMKKMKLEDYFSAAYIQSP
jgi:hypothetical protein